MILLLITFGLRLTYGLDYKGNLCGNRHANPNLGELQLRYWLNPNQVYQSGLKDSQFKLSDARSICLLDCPAPSEDSLNWVCDYPDGDIRISLQDWIDRNYDYFEFLSPEMRNSSLQLQGPCYPVIFPSVNVYWSCQLIARASNMSLRHWQQMGAAMPWITVVLFNILIASVTMFYYLKAGWIGNDGISPVTGEQDLYYHATGRVAVKVIGEVQALIIFPIAPYAFSCTFLHVMVVCGPTFVELCIHYTPHIAIAVLFHLFGGYWATQFIVACSAAVVAGSVASYYWARGETSISIKLYLDVVSIPLNSHQGHFETINIVIDMSIALGSLFVSFVESIRFMLESFRRKLKVAGSTPDAWIGKTTFHSSRFSLKCIEWTIRSINRNAYIMVASTGKSFFRSSEMATELIYSNIMRIGRVNVIGDIILSLGKLCVSLASALFSFLMLDMHKCAGFWTCTSPPHGNP
ncbi:hypothetical protein MLD38_000503 [Melastoma candidum]|uniref:Uncharacterized protein n=1 Tax=Melastoma candidum TaxID=119954 RepID=A0ACB9SB74_9MYRT|nr:hypothetical protein MLD38_000503 [Melastoma candidum]